MELKNGLATETKTEPTVPHYVMQYNLNVFTVIV